MGTRNLAFALVDAPHTILRLGVIDLAKNAARQASENLLDTLSDTGPTGNAWMRDCCDEIVVESQPTNGACKILSFVLMTFFRTYDEMRGVACRPFRFMGAGNKLRLMPDVLQRMTIETYQDRKVAAQRMAMHIFELNDCKFVEFYRGQTEKRKTDVADALIQACRHIQESAKKKNVSAPIK